MLDPEMLPDDPDLLKALFYLCAEDQQKRAQPIEHYSPVLSQLSNIIIEVSSRKPFVGSSEILDDDYLRQVGLIICQSAAAEHVAGEIVAIARFGPLRPNPSGRQWAQSGKPLQDSLEGIVPAEVLSRLSTATDLRNELAHGFHSCAPGDLPPLLPSDSKLSAGDSLTLKRNLRAESGAFKATGWSAERLEKLHMELVELEGILEELKWQIIDRSLQEN